MDQVKKIMRILMEQKFWILCGIVVLLPVGGWFTTTSKMKSLTDARKAAIKQKIDAASSLNGKAVNHPNDESHKAMDLLRNKVTTEVGEAWERQYSRQKHLLIWPEKLETDFIGVVEPLRPLEVVKPPQTAADEKLSINLRERYRDYIAEELPKLAKTIEADWQVGDIAGSESGGAFGGSSGAMPGMASGAGMAGSFSGGSAGSTSSGAMQKSNAKVLWNPQDQTALRMRYDWSSGLKVPRTIDVLYAQEDLWIMTALMEIIANTNQGATGRYNAVVKEISFINLGREVGASTGVVMRVNSAAMSGSSGMPGMGSEGMSSGGMSSAGMPGMAMPGMTAGMPGTIGSESSSGGSGMGLAVGPPDPAQFRYVDLDYKPIAADTLRTAITAESPDPNNAFLVVAKRIPIRMGLTIDQRKLNRFIAACSNAPLMVEVRQVRFNRQGVSGANAGGMGGGGMGGMMGGMMSGMGSGMGSSGGLAGGSPSMGGSGMMGAGMGSGMGSGMGFGSESGSGMPGGSFGGMGEAGGAGTGPSDVSPHDKQMEVYGVVYVYNPVDVKKLGIEKKEVEPETPPPAATPAAPAAPAAAPPAGAAPAATPAAPPAGAAPAAPPADTVPAAAAPPAGAVPPAAPAAAAPPAAAPPAGAAVVPPAGAAPAGAAPTAPPAAPAAPGT